MAVNPYFNHITALNERSLYNDLIVESIKMSGCDVYYIPREDMSVDPILRESFQTYFKSTYLIEMYYTNVTGPSGIGNTMGKFGLQILDEYTFMVSRSRFEELNIPEHIRPREGDLLYIGSGFDSYINNYFEITFVEPDRIYYPLGDYLVFELQCRLFTFNYEKFETNTFIDNIVNDNNNNKEIEERGAINTAVKTKESILLDFNEKNPFGDL